MRTILGLLSAITLCVGVFLPAWEVGPGEYLAIVAFRTEGYLIIACGVAAAFLSLFKKFQILWIPGVGSLWGLSLVYTRVDALHFETRLQWGWIVLLIAAALTIVEPIIKNSGGGQ
jgi:hypothetical protein